MENETIKMVQLAASEWMDHKTLRLEALQNDPQAFGSCYQGALEKPDSTWQGTGSYHDEYLMEKTL